MKIKAQRLAREIHARMAPTCTTEHLLQTALAAVAQHLNAERGCVLTSGGVLLSYPELTDFPFSRRIVDRVLDSGKAMLCADATRGTMKHSQSILMRGVRSVICCPVKPPQSESLLIYLDNAVIRGAFVPDDLDLVHNLFQELFALRNRRFNQRLMRTLTRSAAECHSPPSEFLSRGFSPAGLELASRWAHD